MDMRITESALIDRGFHNEHGGYLEKTIGSIQFLYHKARNEFDVSIDTGMGYMSIPFSKKVETIQGVDDIMQLFS